MKTRVDARRERMGAEQALALAHQVDRVVVFRGEKTVTFDMRKMPDRETLLLHLLGPRGNLRAPTFRRGKTLACGIQCGIVP